MNEGFPEKSKSSRFKIKKLNQISSKSKSLTIEVLKLMRWCAPAEFLCRSACTLSALRRFIWGWVSAREVICGQRDEIRSLAEKPLLSSIFGKLTQKTFARVNDLFFGIIDFWVRDPGYLLCPKKEHQHWDYLGSHASPGPTCGNRESGWNAFTFLEKPISMIKTFNTYFV